MQHHVIAHVNAAVGHAVRVRRIVSVLEENQITGLGIAGRYWGADIVRALRPQPPHIPAGVVEHPADKAGAVKGGGGAAASEYIRVAQILLRLLQHGGKGLILQGLRGHIIVHIVPTPGRVGVFVLWEQIGPVALVGHVPRVQLQARLIQEVGGEVGQIKIVQRHRTDRPWIGLTIAVIPGLCGHILRQPVLLVKEQAQYR